MRMRLEGDTWVTVIVGSYAFSESSMQEDHQRQAGGDDEPGKWTEGLGIRRAVEKMNE